MAAPQPNALKSVRVPLVGTFLNRNGQANTDQRFINCYPESVKAPINNQQKIYLVQRPGFTTLSTIDTINEARGLKYWNGYFYTVYGNKLKRTTQNGVTTTDLTTLYTVPSATTTVVKSLLVTEDAGSGSTITITLVDSSGGIFNLFKDKSIASKATTELLTQPLVMEESEILKVQAADANELHVIASILEIQPREVTS